MKNLFTLFIMATLLSTPACTDNNNDTTQEYTSFVIQDYTSFVIKVNTTTAYKKDNPDLIMDANYEALYNLTTAFYDKDGVCRLIKKHGDIKKTETTSKITIADTIADIFIFFNGGLGLPSQKDDLCRLKNAFPINPKTNNVISIDIIEIHNKIGYPPNSTEYPH